MTLQIVSMDELMNSNKQQLIHNTAQNRFKITVFALLPNNPQKQTICLNKGFHEIQIVSFRFPKLTELEAETLFIYNSIRLFKISLQRTCSKGASLLK